MPYKPWEKRYCYSGMTRQRAADIRKAKHLLWVLWPIIVVGKVIVSIIKMLAIFISVALQYLWHRYWLAILIIAMFAMVGTLELWAM